MQSDLEEWLPNLAGTEYAITSPRTNDYNCFAWAAEEDERWWSPDSAEDYYWPENAPRELTLEAFIQTYGMLGYVPCDSAEVEPEFQKIAIYVNAGEPSHAARQLPNGNWTSKLGGWEDIEHQIEGIENGIGDVNYGFVQQIMKRPIPRSSTVQ
ncbi:hypothetical protein AB3R30_01620 [Leptolyngbyaceae cyanobacterium UHCC 1019]